MRQGKDYFKQFIEHKRALLTPKQIDYVKKSNLIRGLSKQETYDYLYSVGYYNIDRFMDIFLPHRRTHPITGKAVPSANVHREIDDAYKDEEDTVLVLPRGFAKTTRVLVNIVHDLLYGNNQEIGYLANGDLGMESIGRIRIELETNYLVQEVFGKLSPQDAHSPKLRKLKKWKQQYLQLVNGNGLETLSPGQKIRGRRKNKWIVDDPDDDGDSKKKRMAFRRFMDSTIYNTMMPGGYIITIGTIVSHDCYVLYLKNERKRKTIMYPAILKSGKSLWPEMRPLKALEDRKTAIGTASFEQEYMHVPISKENALIKLERCKRRKKLPKFDRRVLSFDPAKKEKEKSDFTGLVYGGIANGKYYVIWTKQIKLSPMKLETYVKAVCDKLKPDYVLKEGNIELGMTERLSKAGYPVVDIHAHKDKRTRLLEASPRVERGEVFFREQGDEELLHQLTNYPDVEHDDIMDAFTQFITYAMTVSSGSIYVIS